MLIPPRRRWTRAEYERATELSLFGPEERLELIEGEIVEKMPQRSENASGIRLSEEAVRRAFPRGYDVRVQMPLAATARSMPEPDIAVVPGSVRDYVKRHPKTATLIIEVADITLEYDRTTKAGIYARAGQVVQQVGRC